MNPPATAETLLADAMRIIDKMHSDRRLWTGAVGFTPAMREDVQELRRDFRAYRQASEGQPPTIGVLTARLEGESA